MRLVITTVLLLAFAGMASANLLLNPSFETQGATTQDAANWNRQQDVAREGWNPMTGSAGMILQGWGSWGFFYQEVSSTLTAGHEATFSIWGNAENNFLSSGNETYMKIEFFDGVSLLSSEETSIYAGLKATPNTWNEYVMTALVPANVTRWQVIVGGGGFIGEGDTTCYFDDASFTTAAVIPEPTVMGLMGLAGVAILAIRRKARK